MLDFWFDPQHSLWYNLGLQLLLRWWKGTQNAFGKRTFAVCGAKPSHHRLENMRVHSFRICLCTTGVTKLSTRQVVVHWWSKKRYEKNFRCVLKPVIDPKNAIKKSFLKPVIFQKTTLNLKERLLWVESKIKGAKKRIAPPNNSDLWTFFKCFQKGELKQTCETCNFVI